MTLENRNFRSCYYEKVGFKGIEENKIGQLLKDNPVDLSKLSVFCSKFSSPPTYRKQMWELLSEVFPAYPAVQEAVVHEHNLHYQDLKHAAKVIGLWKEELPLSQLFLAMWLIESRKIGFDTTSQLQSTPAICVSLIAKALLEIFSVGEDSAASTYFLMKALWNLHGRSGGIGKLKDVCLCILERENHRLYTCLSAVDDFPLNRIFYSLFAGYIAVSELAKVWDKLLSGSYVILAYVGAVMLMFFEEIILSQRNGDDICSHLENLSEDMSELIVDPAIEMWTKKGKPCTILYTST